MVVNSEAKERISVQSEYGQVDLVAYMKLTDEEVAQNQEEYKAQFIFPDSDKKYLSEDEVRAKQQMKCCWGEMRYMLVMAECLTCRN